MDTPPIFLNTTFVYISKIKGKELVVGINRKTSCPQLSPTLLHHSAGMKKIVYLILDLESKYDLLKWDISGIFVWQSARISIYLLLLQMTMPNNLYIDERKFFKKLKSMFINRGLKNSLLLNPFIDPTKSEVLVFRSGRKYPVDSQYIDIYTKYLCDNLKQSKISYTEYETTYFFEHLTRFDFKVKHIDFITFTSKILSKLMNVSISAADIEKIKIIENEIYLVLHVRIDLHNIFVNQIKIFKSQYPFYKILFKIKRPKEIYLINSTDKAPLICAAKDLNIIVNELQHGLIVKEGLVANYPNTAEDSLKYFPDKFFIWDNINLFNSKLPLSSKNIVLFNNMHLEYMRRRTQHIPRKNNQILIISQPTVFQELVNYLHENVNEMPNKQFIYKLHPQDHNLSCFASIYELSKYNNNLKVIDNEVSMYVLLAESKHVLGVYSTALFEASFFKCDVLLLNLPGVEYASFLTAQGKARLIETDDRLVKILGT